MTIENSRGSEDRVVGPVGELAKILNTFEAPEPWCKKIARRAGALVGNVISHEQVENVILKSMETHKGTPNWQEIFNSLGNAVSKAYQGKRPF